MPDRQWCVWCGKAWTMDYGQEYLDWIVTWSTPSGCEHETITGRR